MANADPLFGSRNGAPVAAHGSQQSLLAVRLLLLLEASQAHCLGRLNAGEAGSSGSLTAVDADTLRVHRTPVTRSS